MCQFLSVRYGCFPCRDGLGWFPIAGVAADTAAATGLIYRRSPAVSVPQPPSSGHCGCHVGATWVEKSEFIYLLDLPCPLPQRLTIIMIIT